MAENRAGLRFPERAAEDQDRVAAAPPAATEDRRLAGTASRPDRGNAADRYARKRCDADDRMPVAAVGSTLDGSVVRFDARSAFPLHCRVERGCLPGAADRSDRFPAEQALAGSFPRSLTQLPVARRTGGGGRSGARVHAKLGNRRIGPRPRHRSQWRLRRLDHDDPLAKGGDFKRPDGPVELRLGRGPGSVRCQVDDRGRRSFSISPRHSAGIARRFARGQQPRQSRHRDPAGSRTRTAT